MKRYRIIEYDDHDIERARENVEGTLERSIHGYYGRAPFEIIACEVPADSITAEQADLLRIASGIPWDPQLTTSNLGARDRHWGNPIHCTNCDVVLGKIGEAFYGAGDGRGQAFRCEPCHTKKETPA